MDLLEKMKILNSPLEKEWDFEPHHRSPLVKTMADNLHNETERQKDSLIKTINPLNYYFSSLP